jgi:hypothetical protein
MRSDWLVRQHADGHIAASALPVKLMLLRFANAISAMRDFWKVSLPSIESK